MLWFNLLFKYIGVFIISLNVANKPMLVISLHYVMQALFSKYTCLEKYINYKT